MSSLFLRGKVTLRNRYFLIFHNFFTTNCRNVVNILASIFEVLINDVMIVCFTDQILENVKIANFEEF